MSAYVSSPGPPTRFNLYRCRVPNGCSFLQPVSTCIDVEFFSYNSILLLESGVLPGRSANNTADVQLNKESERHGKYPFAVVVICMYDRKVALCLIYLFNLI